MIILIQCSKTFKTFDILEMHFPEPRGQIFLIDNFNFKFFSRATFDDDLGIEVVGLVGKGLLPLNFESSHVAKDSWWRTIFQCLAHQWQLNTAVMKPSYLSGVSNRSNRLSQGQIWYGGSLSCLCYASCHQEWRWASITVVASLDYSSNSLHSPAVYFFMAW